LKFFDARYYFEQAVSLRYIILTNANLSGASLEMLDFQK